MPPSLYGGEVLQDILQVQVIQYNFLNTGSENINLFTHCFVCILYCNATYLSGIGHYRSYKGGEETSVGGVFSIIVIPGG